jgi:hypothetical protein
MIKSETAGAPAALDGVSGRYWHWLAIVEAAILGRRSKKGFGLEVSDSQRSASRSGAWQAERTLQNLLDKRSGFIF